MKRPRPLAALAAMSLAAGLIACGGENLVLPSEGEPAAITLLQGDGQSGRVGEALPQPLILEVTDATGRPVANATIVTEIEGAEARPDTAATAEDGRATVQVLLGSAVGPARGQARVVVDESRNPIGVDFSVVAVAASANGISLVSGADQTAPAGQTLGEPLVVRVTDAFGNPIGGVTIAWTAVGGGSVSQATTVTDESGLASVTRTLGNTAGAQSTLASSDGLAGSPLTFLHTATAGTPAGVSIVSGNDQTGVPGSPLPQPLVVQVADGDGNPVAGAAVTWVVTGGGGSVNPPTSTTDASGRASTTWTLGGQPGPNGLTAVVSGVGQASFRATAAAGGPGQIRIVSGNGQTGQVGQALAADLVVAVVDGGGNPVPGATVTWTPRTGGGSAGPATSTTDATGQASTRWTLGSAPGGNTLEASVSGVGTVTFQATATAGAPASLALRTQPSGGAEAGVPFGRQPVVELRDAAGNPVAQSGVAVTVAIASGPGSLGGTTTRTTDSNGRVAFTDLEINGATGAHTLIFAASGFTSETSGTIDVVPAETETEITGDAPDPSQIGEAVTVSFSVTSAAGAPEGTVTVTASGGGETCSAAVTVGSCAITLTASGSRTLTAAYGGGALFEPSDDDESHTVAAANSAPTAADDEYETLEGGDETLTVPAPGVLGNDDDPDGGTLQAQLVAGPANGTLELDAGGGFRYTPNPDYFGDDSFTYRATDGTATSGTATVRITVRPVNDSPRFTRGPDQTASVAAGAQTVAGWASDIVPGPANESGQSVTFFVNVESGAELFATAPTISPDGTLSYTPAAPGIATVSVLLRDDGGTGNGGRDTSDPVTVTFSFTP